MCYTYLLSSKMSEFELKNTSDKAVLITLTRKVKDGDIEKEIKEDISLYPGDKKVNVKLAGSHIDFASPVDFTFRQKAKALIGTKTKKERVNKVRGADLPGHFVLLKVKNVHTE